jgi:hypothetical protein
MVLQTGVMSYGGSSTTISIPGVSPNGQATEKPVAAEANGTPAKTACAADPKKCNCGCKGKSAGGPPKFSSMTNEERLEYHRKRISRLLGER